MKTACIALTTIAALLTFQTAQAEDVSNGGEILRGLIERCDILGISSSNGGGRIGLRLIRQQDIGEVKFNSLIINNLDADESSVRRPKQIALFLNKVDRDASGDIIRYYISGRFSSKLPDEPVPGLQTDGILSEIAFAPSDRIPLSIGDNTYKFRGQMRRVFFKPSDLGSSYSETISGWDLAVPAQFDKETLCNVRETNPRDVIFIR